MTQSQVIALYQPTLQSIAMKMLGSISDAEDAVQDAFVKWLTIDTSKIENAKSYLVKMVTNNCLTKLQQRKKQLEIVDEEVGEFLEDQEKQKSFFHFDLENQIKEAWGNLHHRLEPVERAIFVLREVFQVDYEDLQEIAGRKADNCRKIVSRAKEKLNSAELPRIKISLPDHKLLDSVMSAYHKGNLSQLIQDFSLDLFKKKK